MSINTTSNPFTTILNMLASIGAINWGLVGVIDFNLVSYLVGESTTAKIIYALIGFSGLYIICVLSSVVGSAPEEDD